MCTVDASVVLHVEIWTLFHEPLQSFVRRQGVFTEEFFGASMTHSCELSRLRGLPESPGVFLLGDSAHVCTINP